MGNGRGPEDEEMPTEDTDDFEIDDYIEIYISNRNHLRDLSKIMAPVAGLILTGTFGLLYFILNGKDKGASQDITVVVFTLAVSILLIGSILSSVQSVRVKSEHVLIATKIQYLDDLVVGECY